MEKQLRDTHQKALNLNLDPKVYGTFAEIGAGQEVCRWFFRVGGASGSVAKTMSAYDMTFSDEIYGKAKRYVSKERLLSMLDHEYELLVERLDHSRGSDTTFFVFANTASARNYQGTNQCHGWIGIRFQTEPRAEPCDILLHVNLQDTENVIQQQALGIVGVNLLYGAFRLFKDPIGFLKSLTEGLAPGSIEVDRVEFFGPAFTKVKEREINLSLLRLKLASAIMFDLDGEIVPPSEVLYKRPVIIERGTFREVSDLHIDMIEGAERHIGDELTSNSREPIALFEMTFRNLVDREPLTDKEVLARVDGLVKRKHYVLMTNYSEYYHLTEYLRRYTKQAIRFVIGVNSLVGIFNHGYYEHLPGGILEAFGKLLQYGLKIYVYPMKIEGYREFLTAAGLSLEEYDVKDSDVVTAENVRMLEPMKYLYDYLYRSGYIIPVLASR